MDSHGFLQQLFGLEGRTALVTGASSGLGVCFARALSRAGANVALLARRLERLETLAAELGSDGPRCLALQADVTDSAQLDGAWERIDAELGLVDILVNNAGVAPVGKAEAHRLDEWNRALAVNLTAAMALSQRVARRLIAAGRGGRIIHVSSVVGQAANPIYPTAAYTASKGGLEMLTRQQAIEWARYGITVNALAPGWFPTEMTTDPRFGDVHPRFKERMLARIPLGRLGEERDLTGALLYLASAASRYSTGTTLVVDGGWLAG